MTDNWTEDDFADIGTPEQLASVAFLAGEQVKAEDKVLQAESALSELKRNLRMIQEKLLPDALFAAGLSETKTTNGDKITLKEDLSVSVPKDKKSSIIEWLETNGHSEVVSGQIVVDLPRNSHNERTAAIEALVEAGFEPIENTSVNTATLKAILKDHLAKGEPLKLEDFGAFSWRKTIIKRR